MPIELSRDAFLALKRCFIAGDLREQSPLWLTLPREPFLAFSGDGVEECQGGGSIELGTVRVLGEHRHTVHVESLCEGSMAVALPEPLAWLRASWRGTSCRTVELRRLGDSADLDLVLRGEPSEPSAEQTLAESLWLVASTPDGQTRTYGLEVRLRTGADAPFGRFNFHGAPEPSPHDFGTLDASDSEAPAPYLLAVENIGHRPLQVVLEDLPAWLAVEMNGFTRRGLAPGRFFEGEAPLILAVRPLPSVKLLGARSARFVLRTNDARERYRRMEIDFHIRIVSRRALVSAGSPGIVELVPPARRDVEILLSNWGIAPARLSLEEKSCDLVVGPLPTVPPAAGNQAGQAALQLSISSLGLPPGHRVLGLDLRVEGGSPATIGIRIQVHVLGITTEPAQLDFGRVRAGRVKQLTLRAVADDGRALDLEASPRAEAASVLAVSAQHNLVHVVCRGSAERLTFQGPGIEIRDRSLGFSRQIPVSFRSGTVSPGMVAGVACALVAFLLIILLFWKP